MARKEKPKHPIGDPCIFCGGRPLSREHVLPWWTRKLLTKPETLGYVLRTTNPFTPHVPDKEKIYRGYLSNNKLKIVCERCNNGWMSEIEHQAIPILTPLMTGEDITLNEQEQIIVAKWCVLRIIILEFMTPYQRGILDTELHFFKEHKAPPPHWKIWIGKANTDLEESNYGHSALRSIGAPKPNMHAAYFIFGNLLVHTFSCAPGTFSYSLKEDLPDYLRPIYPYQSALIDWSQLLPFDSKAIFTLVHNVLEKREIFY